MNKTGSLFTALMETSSQNKITFAATTSIYTYIQNQYICIKLVFPQ